MGTTQALELDTGRYAASTAPLILYVIRTIIRVKSCAHPRMCVALGALVRLRDSAFFFCASMRFENICNQQRWPGWVRHEV